MFKADTSLTVSDDGIFASRVHEVIIKKSERYKTVQLNLVSVEVVRCSKASEGGYKFQTAMANVILYVWEMPNEWSVQHETGYKTNEGM